MISGAWGAGKTHFWKNEIEKELAEKLKKKEQEKACVYVSLYGKESIDAIKDETLFKAYESIKDENQLKKKAISAFGVGSRALSFSAFGFKLSAKELSEKLEAYDEEKKIEEAESFIENGGVICLDDFERKSKNIDLNDLFGFISQLSLELNCKVIIILNSDVFSGEEAKVFRTVKEKTVSKFFYYEPTVDELFKSIIESDSKYSALVKHQEDILNAILETKVLNARIYSQVLDNCLEWETNEQTFLDSRRVRLLVLVNINFILNHIVFEAHTIEVDLNESQRILDTLSSFNSTHRSHSHKPEIVERLEINLKDIDIKDYKNILDCIEYDFFDKNIIERTIQNIKQSKNKIITEAESFYIDYVQKNENYIKSLSFLHFFRLYGDEHEVDEVTFNEVNTFVKTGILVD